MVFKNSGAIFERVVASFVIGDHRSLMVTTTSLPIRYLWKITSSKIAKDAISRFSSLQILGE